VNAKEVMNVKSVDIVKT